MEVSLTKRKSIGSIALYGIGGIICLLAGAQSIGAATTENNEMFVGMAFMLVGAFGMFRAFMLGTRS